MSCNIPVRNGVRRPADCKCYGAVLRTYASMRDEPQHIAIEAARLVYSYHHPEDSKEDAFLTVQRWVTADEQVH